MDEFERALVGEELNGVTFVRDYVQLQFNPPPMVNALTPVTVSTASVSATLGEPDFANLLIGQIGKSVQAVEFRESNALRLLFEDGSTVSISLKPGDRVGPEAVTLIRKDGTWIVE